MGIVPGLEHDCFISYRHLDDLGPDGNGGHGWVSRFHQELTVKLGEFLGEPPQIWRDPRLDGNDVFPDELNDRVRASAVLIPIVSPGYRRSSWCTREFEIFKQSSSQAHRWTVGNRLATMKVVRTPLDRDEQNVFPVESLGYWFFERNRATGRPVRHDSGSPAYEQRLEELAQDTADFLRALATGGTLVSPAAPKSLDRSAPPPKPVLLACDVFGLDRDRRVIGISCVAVDEPDELSKRLDQVKSSIALDPTFSADVALMKRIRRSGLRYEDDDPSMRERIASELAVLPWDGYVSFADSRFFASKGDDETVLMLLEGILFDRIRSLFDAPVEVVLSPRLAQFWQGVSEAAAGYRQKIKTLDKVTLVGTSTVRVGERNNAAVEVANYLGGLTGARLADPSADNSRGFLRIYPNKLRLIHDVQAHAHYSRRHPLPSAWRLP
ncbi:MAG: hypothetical protein ABJA98_15105 [Acidobacteriota bacterium]